jgi:hypothetical protein
VISKTPKVVGGKLITWMVQFDAKGKYVRRARYNRVLLAVWKKQIPHGHIILK